MAVSPPPVLHNTGVPSPRGQSSDCYAYCVVQVITLDWMGTTQTTDPAQCYNTA